MLSHPEQREYALAFWQRTWAHISCIESLVTVTVKSFWKNAWPLFTQRQPSKRLERTAEKRDRSTAGRWASFVIGRLVDKIDLKSELKDLYKPSAKEVVEVDVPAFNFLMVDGEGNPNTSKRYEEAVEALYSVSYAIKFALKKENGLDYVVMPLEGLWWADDFTSFNRDEKESWKRMNKAKGMHPKPPQRL